MTKPPIPQELRIWIETRRRYHLTDAHIQMARELELDPRRFGAMANCRDQPWKIPLPDYIAALYLKRFRKAQPDVVVAIEQIAADKHRKKEQRREQRRQASNTVPPGTGECAPGIGSSEAGVVPREAP